MIPVLVVGGGPVGMVAALELANRGVATTLVDQSPTPSTHPRLDVVNSRSMELLHRWGLDADIRAVGVAPRHSFDVLWSTGLDGELVTSWELPSVDEAWRLIHEHNDGSQPAQPWQRLSQAVLEPVLRARCAAHPLIDDRWGVRCESIEQDPAGVTAELTEGEVRAAHVIGCDGASSTIRASLGIGLTSGGDVPDLPGAYMVHFRSRDLTRLHRHGQFWHYFAFRYVILAQDEVDTWTFHAHGVFDPPDPVAFMRSVMGVPVEVDEVLLVSRWAPQFLIADAYRAGRVFLAGDAAHQMFPTGGYGMNTGVADAVDVAWKLAAVHQGWGAPALLDSYEVERRPVGLRNMRTSFRHLGVHLEAGGMMRAGEPLDAVARYLEAERGENEYAGVELGYRYTDSPVISHPSGPEPLWEPENYTPTTWPGGRPPSLVLADGTFMYDRLGPDYTLVDLGGSARFDPSLPVRHLVISDPHAREVWERDLVLVRPDHHVAWRGSRLPADFPSLVRATAVT